MVAEINSERRLKSQKAKSKASEGRKHLSSVRVIQRNLVYIIGLPNHLADESVSPLLQWSLMFTLLKCFFFPVKLKCKLSVDLSRPLSARNILVSMGRFWKFLLLNQLVAASILPTPILAVCKSFIFSLNIQFIFCLNMQLLLCLWILWKIKARNPFQNVKTRESRWGIWGGEEKVFSCSLFIKVLCVHGENCVN